MVRIKWGTRAGSAPAGIAALAAVAAMAAFPVSARADAVADFYKGKTVSIVVGHEAGTGFDIYSRVIIRHMGRHIPGNPSMVVQNMPGASGINAANWLYAIAPSDGTVMATFTQNVPFEPLFGNKAAQFDARKFNWLGHLDKSVAVCGVSPAAGVKTFDDLRKGQTLFGATGATGPIAKSTYSIMNLFDLRLRVVSGYKGSASLKSAMQRGEVHGVCGLTWSTLTSFWAEELKSGEFRPIIQLSGDPHEELKGVAHARDLSTSLEQRQLYNLVFGVYEIGRFYLMPPGVPADRVAAMRKALMDLTRDPEFLADADKARIDINPRSGEELTAVLEELLATPADIVARAVAVTNPPPK